MPHTILVVDDERHVLDVVRAMVSRRGDRAILARDGREALRQIAETRPDLILLDLMLPGMDGASLAQALRDRPATADIPVIFITGLVEIDEVRRRGPSFGGHLFLAKPFDATQLYEVIDLAMGT